MKLPGIPICFVISIMTLTATLANAHSKPVEKKRLMVEVTVASQPEAPLLLAIQSVDNSADSHQKVSYTLHNQTDKPVKGSVIKYKSPLSGAGSVTSYYGVFAGNSANESSLRFERTRINENISLTIDYVLFADGSTWGDDSLKMSAAILGFFEGKQAAVDEFRQLVDAGDENRLVEIFTKELSDLQPPNVPASESDRWKKSFLSGYRSTVSTFKRDFEHRGIQGIADRLKNPHSF